MGSLKVPLSGPAVRNALHLGSSFCLQFLAFSVAQNFQTVSESGRRKLKEKRSGCTNMRAQHTDIAFHLLS
jgi:hypothetical protein